MNPYAPGAAAMSRPGGVGASSLSRPGSAGVGASSSMSRPGSAGVGATSAGIVGGLTSSAAAKASSSLVGGLTSGAAAKATSSSGLVGGLGAAKASAGVVGGLTSSAASKASAGAVGGLTAGVGAKPSGIGVGGGLSSASAGVGSKSVTMGGVSSTSASSSLARPGSAGVGVGAKPGTSTGSTASPYGAKAPGTTGFGSTSPYSSMGGAKAGATVGSTSPYAGVGLSKAGAGVGVGGSSASATTATGLVAGAKVGSGVQSSASNPRGSVIISQLVDDSKARAGAGGVVTDPTGPSQMPMVQATAPMPPPEKQDAAASWLSKLDSYKAEEDQKKADIESLKVAKTPPQTTPRDDKKDEEDDLSPMSFAEKTGGSMKTTLGGPPQYGPKIPNIASFSVDALRRGSLHFYTYMGQYEHVDFLLKEADRVGDGFFVNATEAYGERTALHYACFQGEVEIANLLIEKGADLHARDKERRTPMHYACFRGATKIVRSMVGIAVHRLRADSNKKYRQLKLQAPGYDPEYGEEGGYERKCAAQCCLEYFKNIEDLRFKFLASEDRKGMTPLHYAVHDVWQGCLATCTMLLETLTECQARKISKENNVMADPKYLVGVAPTTRGGPNFSDYYFRLLLPHEVKNLKGGHKERSAVITDELLNGADCFGYTLLHHASVGGNYRCTHVLLTNGADAKARTVVPTTTALGGKSNGANSSNKENIPGQLGKTGGSDLELRAERQAFSGDAVVGITAFELAKDVATKKALQGSAAGFKRQPASEGARQKTLAGLSPGGSKLTTGGGEDGAAVSPLASKVTRGRANTGDVSFVSEGGAGGPSFLADPVEIARQRTKLAERYGDYVNEEQGIYSQNGCHAALFDTITMHTQAAEAGKDGPTPSSSSTSPTKGRAAADAGQGGAAAQSSLRALLDAHPETNPWKPDASGWTSIHYAASHGKHGELRVLLRHSKKHLHDPNCDDRNGMQNAFLWRERDEDGTKAASTGRLDSDAINILTGPLQPGGGQRGMNKRPKSAGVGGRSGGTAYGLVKPQATSSSRGGTMSFTLSSKGSNVGGGGSKRAGKAGLPPGPESLLHRTPTHVAAQAAAGGHADVILKDSAHVKCLEVLEDEGWLQLETRDHQGNTPILLAGAAGATAAVQWLINHGADPFVTDNAGRTLLHLALLGGHGPLTRLLVYFDSDRGNFFRVKDCRGQTPSQLLGCAPGVKSEDLITIWDAARRGDIDKLRAALRIGADIDTVSPSGWTPLMYCAASGHAVIARYLLGVGAAETRPILPHPLYNLEVFSAGGGVSMSSAAADTVVACCRPHKGRLPMHLAAEQGSPEICTLLHDIKGQDLNVPCEDLQKTPLMYACSNARIESVDALLKNPRVDLFAVDARGRTCLHWLALCAAGESGLGESKVVEPAKMFSSTTGASGGILSNNMQGRVKQALVSVNGGSGAGGAGGGSGTAASSGAKRAKVDSDCAQIAKLIVSLVGVKKASALWKRTYIRRVSGAEQEITALDEIKELDRLRHGSSSDWKSKTQNMLLRLEHYLKEETRKRDSMMKELDEKAGYQIERIQEYEKSGVILPKNRVKVNMDGAHGAAAPTFGVSPTVGVAGGMTAASGIPKLATGTVGTSGVTGAAMVSPATSSDVGIINSLAAKGSLVSASAAGNSALLERNMAASGAAPKATTATAASTLATGVARPGGSLVGGLGSGGPSAVAKPAGSLVGGTGTTATSATASKPAGLVAGLGSASATAAAKPAGLVAGIPAKPAGYQVGVGATAAATAKPAGAGLVGGLTGAPAKPAGLVAGLGGAAAKPAGVGAYSSMGVPPKPAGLAVGATSTGVASKPPGFGTTGVANKPAPGSVAGGMNIPPGVGGPPKAVGAMGAKPATSAAIAKQKANLRAGGASPGSDGSYGESFASESIEISDDSSDSPIVGLAKAKAPAGVAGTAAGMNRPMSAAIGAAANRPMGATAGVNRPASAAIGANSRPASGGAGSASSGSEIHIARPVGARPQTATRRQDPPKGPNSDF